MDRTPEIYWDSKINGTYDDDSFASEFTWRLFDGKAVEFHHPTD